MTSCTNCGSETADIYCARCGERQPGHHDLSVKHFAHETVHELVHVDSKLFTTLRDLIARPGFLPEEYFAGRKSRYIPPLRLFLVLFAIQFLAFTFYKPAAMYSVSSFAKFDTRGALTRLLEKRATKLQMPIEEYKAKVDERWHKNLSLLQLATLVGVAIVLKILHHRRYLAEHLVFSAYYLSFSYIVSLLSWPVYAIYGFHPGLLQKTLAGLAIAVHLIYLYFAQRRFYGGKTGATLLKTVLLWGGIYLVFVVILAGSLFAAVVQQVH